MIGYIELLDDSSILHFLSLIDFFSFSTFFTGFFSSFLSSMWLRSSAGKRTVRFYYGMMMMMIWGILLLIRFGTTLQDEHYRIHIVMNLATYHLLTSLSTIHLPFIYPLYLPCSVQSTTWTLRKDQQGNPKEVLEFFLSSGVWSSTSTSKIHPKIHNPPTIHQPPFSPRPQTQHNTTHNSFQLRSYKRTRTTKLLRYTRKTSTILP